MYYDAANRKTTGVSGTTTTVSAFEYAGNTIRDTTLGLVTTMTYNGENQLISIVNPDRTRSTMTYQGGDGLRRSLHAGTKLTTFVWDGVDYLQERY